MSERPDLERRELLKTAAISGALGAVAGTAVPQARAASSSVPEITGWEAVRLAHAIHSREVSCEEVMRAHLERISHVNGTVNAIVSLQDPDELIRQARQKDAGLAAGAAPTPLYGFPHAVKDLEDVKGIRFTRGGSPLFKSSIGETDDLLVQRLRAAGVIIIGKTNAPEFGLGSHTVNRVFGATRNPYSSEVSCGGSSGGAAVGLALRMLPVADGSDFGGSLRNPAGWNNVCGFRPSIGRVPSIGGDLWSPSMSVSGPMGRTVADAALLLSVLAGPDRRSPLSLEGGPAQFRGSLQADFKGKRIAWLGDYRGTVPYEAGIVDVCKQALKRFTALGCTVEDDAPVFDVEQAWQAFVTLRAASTGTSLAAIAAKPEERALLNEQAAFEVEKSQQISLADVIRAADIRSQWTRALYQLFEKYDYLVAPTAQLFPFAITQPWPTEIAGQRMRTYHEWMKGVCLVTLSGCPVLAVPAGFGGARGLPIGLQVIAPFKQDMSALKLGAAYEAVEPLWRLRAPKV